MSACACVVFRGVNMWCTYVGGVVTAALRRHLATLLKLRVSVPFPLLRCDMHGDSLVLALVLIT